MKKIKNVSNKLKKLWKNVGETGYSLKAKIGSKGIELMSKYRSRPQGIVQLDIIDVITGKRIGGFVEKNVIVDLARETMCKIINNDDVDNRVLEFIKFSDGGHNPTTLEPLVPTVSDTGLNNAEVISKSISAGDVTVAFPDNKTARYQMSLEANEGNGTGFQVYSELGLFTKGGVCFSHKTFGAQTKSNTIRLNFTYTVLF
jgi:hypothetical protein